MNKLGASIRVFFTSVFLFSIVNLLYAQDVLWEKSYGGAHGDYLYDAQSTADFGFILAGSSVSEKSGNKQEKGYGGLDYFIWKMDEQGSLDWQKTYGGPGSDFLQKIITTRDGGFLLAGTSDSAKGGLKKDDPYGMGDFWVVKLNADGSEQWQRTIGGVSADILKTAMELPEGGYLLAGSSSSPKSKAKKTKNQGNKDYWVIKLDSAGEVEWESSFGGKYVDEIEAVCSAPDKGFYLLGYSNSPDGPLKAAKNLGGGDYWLIRIDKLGNLIWEKAFGGEGDDHPYAMLRRKNGNILVGGISSTKSGAMKQAANSKGTDFWVFEMDNESGIVWEETYDIGEYDVLSSMEENNDRTVLLAGYAKSENVGRRASDSRGINDYVAIKIKPDGKEKWRQEIGSKGEDVLKRLIETRGGGYLMAGTSSGAISGERNSKQGRSDFWVVKLGDEDKDKNEEVSFVEAFPNPTDRFTNIIITEDFERGTAFLYDINGRQLQQYELTGRTLPVDLRNLPMGIYLVKVKTDIGESSVKIIKKDQ
ncbi:T9SS type A sorting domain-containing protein [Flavobacteriaceae bacterium TK19130]|nr:T9SS type A sorting domain-containing protein [Thermobacterium salinum]